MLLLCTGGTGSDSDGLSFGGAERTAMASALLLGGGPTVARIPVCQTMLCSSNRVPAARASSTCASAKGDGTYHSHDDGMCLSATSMLNTSICRQRLVRESLWNSGAEILWHKEVHKNLDLPRRGTQYAIFFQQSPSYRFPKY